jgi:hypothetical protein
MNWEVYGRNQMRSNLRCYVGICLEGLRKFMKELIQDTQSLCHNLNPRLPE